MNKETLKTIAITVLTICLLYAILIVIIGKNIIDDLTISSKYYKEHYNECRLELEKSE